MRDSGGGYFATKTYQCGRIGEKVKFFVPSVRRPRQGKSDRKKIEGNNVNMTRRVARAINENFVHGDGWLALNYTAERYQRVLARAAALRAKDGALTEMDAIWFAAQHELELLMDRARGALRKRGIELRYVAITADIDGGTGEAVKVHHHVVCPAECVEVIKEKWGLKGEDAKQERRERLWNQEDYTPLAEYMMRQVRYIADAKKYTPSRNLIRTEPSPRTVFTGARLRPPKGAVLLYADPYTGVRDCQYIRYLLPPEKWTGVWKGKKVDGLQAGAGAGTLKGPEMKPGPKEGQSPGAKEGKPPAGERREVRCAACGRLLGVVQNGEYENKHGRQVIRAVRAVVRCPKCGAENKVGTGKRRGGGA